MQFGVASGSKLSDGLKSYGAGETKDAGLKLDPEQQEKYDEIISLLLAGGYFRARISTLNPFDKVRHYAVYNLTILAASTVRFGSSKQH